VSGALRRLCGAELRDVLEVRRGLEVEGARLAASNRTAEDLATLRTLLDRRNECERDGRTDDFARADAEFHLAIVRSSHNAVLSELYRGLLEAITASVAATTETPVEILDHGVLLDYVAAGDVEQAARAAGEMLDGILAGLPTP
jgi:DNA-binding FadR family transcriptional regulator